MPGKFIDRVDKKFFPSGEDDLVNLVKNITKKHEGFVEPLLRDSQFCHEFIKGNQWVRWDSSERECWEPERRGKYRLTFNHYRPTIQNLSSRLTGVRMMWEGLPRDSSEKAYRGTISTNRFFRAVHIDQGMEHLMSLVTTEALLSPVVFVKTLWDTQGGELRQSPGTTTDLFSGDKILSGEEELTRTGWFSTTMVPFQDAIYDQRSSSMETSLYWGHRIRKTLDDWEEIYGVRPARSGPRGGAWPLLNEMWNMVYGSSADRQEEEFEESAVGVEMWFRKQKRFPQGAVITIAGDSLVRFQKNPYAHGNIPVVAYNEFPMANSIAGLYTGQLLLEPQALFNLESSRQAELVDTRCDLPWGIPFGTEIDIEEFEQGLAKYYRFDATAGNIAQPQVQNLPSEFFAHIASIKENFFQQSGLQEIARGQVPFSGMSAALAALIIEQTETPLGITRRAFKASYERQGDMVRSIGAQYLPKDVLMHIIGEDSDPESFLVSGSDLRQVSKVIVRTTSAAKESMAVRNSAISEMLPAVSSTNPEMIKELLRAMEVGGLPDIWRKMDVDKRKQRKEIDKMERGEEVKIDPMDNHQDEISEIENLRKSEDWDILPDDLKQKILAHRDEHSKILQERAEQAKQDIVEQAQMAKLAGIKNAAS